MKRVLLASGVLVGVTGSGLSIVASRFDPVLPAGSIIGVVPVGGLTPEEAKKRVRLWWESERTAKTLVTSKELHKDFGEVRWDALGMGVDDDASVAQIPLDAFVASVARQLNLKPHAGRFPVVFSFDPSKLKLIEEFVLKNAPEVGPARVTWAGGKVVRKYESGGIGFDSEAMTTAIKQAFENKASSVDIALKTGVKRIPDAELDKIVEPMATFTTKFSAGNRPRSANIKLASEIVNGIVLMPGEQFVFNERVGQRTLKRGFQVAGVYVNGRHDEGVGGGICQVSTTLYNSVLMSDLKIVQRSNHSLPVPYVPTGRDATVSFPKPDFVFENNYDFPIALSSQYVPGSLTFAILGVKDKSLKVEIQRGKVSFRGRGTKYVHDPSLPFGKTRVVDHGGDYQSVPTWRLVYRNGKLERKDSLGTSIYPGAPRLIAKNMKAKAPEVESPVTTPTPDELPDNPDEN